MQLVLREVEDMFDMKDLRYDVKMKVGTDGLKEIKIGQLNMLMQQAGNLVQIKAVPPQVIGLLFADMADAMDRPDIAKMVETYQPQPDPMTQAHAEADLGEKQSSTAKNMALAKSADARARNEDVKTQKEVGSMDADLAKKYADVNKTMSDMETSQAKVGIDAAKAVREINAPESKPATAK